MKNRNHNGSKLKLGAVLALLLAGVGTGPAWAVLYSTSVAVTADTGLDAFWTSANMGNQGALSAGNGNTDPVPEVGRQLVRFDLSAIPVNATVLSATLRLAFTGNNFATATTLSLYRMTTAWTEGTGAGFPGAASAGATWNAADAAGPTLWNAAGAAADHLLTPSGSLTSAFQGSTSSRVDFSFTGLAADAQYWVNNPLLNAGWILLNSNEANFSHRKQFWTKEYAAAGFPADGMPYLDIQYEYAPEPTTAALLAVGGLILWRRRS